jgi:hypothetical protein
MVAALFEGDLRYGVSVFGKPTSLDGIITPDNYALPNTLRQTVGVDFIFYEGVELFRAFRIEGDANNLTLFSIQTHAFSISSGRAGPFIGAGIFARAAVNPVALVKALRELLHGAQAVLMRDGRFIVEEIGAKEKRLVSIPDSVDAVPDRNGYWFEKPINTNHSKHMLILPNAAGVKSAEEFFANVMHDPYAYSRNAFFCTNSRVADDCRQRSDEFDVLTVDKVLGRHRLAYEALVHKNNAHAKSLAQREQQHAQQIANKTQEHEHATLEIRNSVHGLRAANSTLASENDTLRRQLDRLARGAHDGKRYVSNPIAQSKIKIFLRVMTVLCITLLLGFVTFKLYPFFNPSVQPSSTSKDSSNGAAKNTQIGIETAGGTRPHGIAPQTNRAEQ